MPQQDPLEFDFTEAEMYAGLRLVVSEPEARAQAAEFARTYQTGMNWGIDDDGLLQLLAIGSETGARRVARLVRALRQARYDGWRSDQLFHDPSISNAEIERRWARFTRADDKSWTDRLNERRRTLREQGRLPPDLEA
ncbi:MAG TPA: hypothetical protein VFY65_20395 [Longimicrobium sp.]|nr:hypothetical protein [Longimicrobium sp.]